MASSPADTATPQAIAASIDADTLTVELSDGRAISIPLAWYPRLAHATPEERGDWRLIGGGAGLHWPALDEDIRVAALLAGKRSGEGRASLQRWLSAREG